MANCQACGTAVTQPFECSQCGHVFCGEHRLPESHGCQHDRGQNAELTGEGPNTDRLKTTGEHGDGSSKPDDGQPDDG